VGEKPIFYNSRFIKSATELQDKPQPELPEVAFAGRSNVGKSSLLNRILNRKQLAKISSAPGKTRLINYFLINERFYFVDLPGYGYAKISRQIQQKWQGMLEGYLLKSASLRLVCLLIDSRHKMMESDAQMADWLNYHDIPYAIVLTKTDKISKSELRTRISFFSNQFPDHHILPFSIKSKPYTEQLSAFILSAVE